MAVDVTASGAMGVSDAEASRLDARASEHALAALGLVLVMFGAVGTRIRRQEIKFMLAHLGRAACVAAMGRFGPESFTG